MIQQLLIALGVIVLGIGSQGIALAIVCPNQPEQTIKDWEVEVNAAVAKIVPVSGGELKTKTKNATQDILGKLPNADRVYLEQMMFATYCSALRDDKALSESQKAKILNEYIGTVHKTIQQQTPKIKQPTSAPPLKQPGKEKESGSPSDLAREALVRLGVGWTSDSFADAIVRGDIRSVALFLAGGMTPELNHKGASMALYALQPAAANRSEILKLFLARGMDPNKNLVDTRIMPSYGSLPPHFDEKLAPVGYGAWNKTFVGPADLWVVIRGAYAGSTDGDFDLLRLLAANGATMRTSLLFLKSYESIWGNTPVYWDVRKKVESLKGIAPSLPPPAARAVTTAPTVETCGPSPLTKRPAEEFIGRWVSQVNLLYRTRNEQYRDLENLMQVQGARPSG